MNFLFFCENFLLERFFFFVFEIGGSCSLCELTSLLIYLTLLSIVIFHNVISFKENVNVLSSFGSIISKQQIQNLFRRILSSKIYEKLTCTIGTFFTRETLYFLCRIKTKSISFYYKGR